MAHHKSGARRSDAISLTLRIATVALSVASAALTMTSANESNAAAGSCAPAGKISYSDYNSFKYTLAADLVTAVLQVVVAWLRARGCRNDGKVAKFLVEILDTASQVLLYSSSALSFAVDDFGTCAGGGRVGVGVFKCKCGSVFCQRVHSSGAISLASGIALSVSELLVGVDVDVQVTISFDGEEQDASPGCGHGSNHCHDRD